MARETFVTLVVLSLFYTAARCKMVAKCPEGWIPRGGSDQCYRMHTYGKTRNFNDARSYCRAHGGDLVSVDSSVLRNWLSLTLAEAGVDGENADVWVGAHKQNGNWKWIENNNPIDFNIVDWEGTGPEDGGCGAFSVNSKLVKYSCKDTLHFLCHRAINVPPTCDYENGWENLNKNCYKGSNTATSWHNALIECTIEGGSLISITGSQEQQFATDIAISHHDNVWIGLTEEGHPGEWKWVDENDSTYRKWNADSQQPDESYNGFGAAVVDHEDPAGRWEVERVTQDFHYVCKKKEGACVPGWEEFGDSCYYFNTEPEDRLVWDDAKSTCQKVGAKLVIINSLAEDEFFRSHMPQSDALWIGLYSKKDDGFYWVDNTKMNPNVTFITDEDQNEALNSGQRTCVYFQIIESEQAEHSSWVPFDCTEPKHYACEVPTGKALHLIPPTKERYCPEGWEENLDHCYYFGFEEKTWTSARKECRKQTDGELVSILTWAEQDFVFNHQKADSWIGFTTNIDGSNWKWSDDSDTAILNWNSGEPTGGKESCGEILLGNGKWNDVPCSVMRTYTCKTIASSSPVGTPEPPTTPPPDFTACGWDWTENPVSGECYRVELYEYMYDDARLHCTELDTHGSEAAPDLVSLNSAQEQNFVHDLVAQEHLSQSTLWIGLYKDSTTLYWLDNTIMSYFNFETGEPNNIYYENCIEMYVNNGKWNDVDCNARHSFICEKKGPNYVDPVQPPPPPEVRCPDGWNYRNNHCYYFAFDYKTWDDARASCKAQLGSDLASIVNQDENDYLYGVLYESWSNAWLGIHDDNAGSNWYWTDGTDLNRYQNWKDGEPNNNDGNEHCGEIRTIDSVGQWNDMPCDILNPYVCKTSVNTCPESWTLHEGKCYYASNFEATWSDARSICKEFNNKADLISIHSQDENDFFGDVMTHTSQGVWVGLHYDAEKTNWTWSDGQSVDYLNWNGGEPNNMDFEFCTELIENYGSDLHAKWNNHDCSITRSFGCEFFPTHRIGCEDGWEEFGDYCYFFSNADYSYTEATYKDAREDCQSKGGDLVSIHSAEENDFVYSLNAEDYYYDTWIGMTDSGHSNNMEWSDGTSLSYASWMSPDHAPFDSSPTCACYSAMDYSGLGLWDLEDCELNLFYTCKKPKEAVPINPPNTGCKDGDHAYKGSCYNNPGYAETWQDAKRGCNDVGSHLLVINDRFEDAFISSAFGELKLTAWIGLFSTEAADGTISFSWVNGDPVDFVKWGEYEPAANHGTCVIASGSDSVSVLGLWFVEDCNDQYQYICEYDREDYKPNTPPPTDPPGTYCAPGWERRKGRCYKVFSEPRTWPKAEDHCASYGGHLTSVSDADEQNVIKALSGMAEINDLFASVWIGLKINDDGEGFMWTDGTPFSYIDWAPGQPNYHHNREGCGSADRSALQYSDTVCETILPYVCEAGEGLMVTTMAPPTETPDVFCDDDNQWLLFSEYCYKFVSNVDDDPQTWHTSHRRCRDDGSELASIHTQEENYWIESKIFKLSDDSMWVGGRAKFDSGYEWLDGTPFDYVNWAEGEPNNVFDQEDCLSLYNHKQGYWNDLNCAQTRGRICKKLQHATFPPAKTTQAPEGHCPQGWIHAGTKCLNFTAEQKTFEEARSACRELSSRADLVSIHSPLEQAYLTAALEVVGVEMWIGLRNQGGFHWIDQSAVTYTNWAAGEPNGQNNGEDCVEMYHHDGSWNDRSCDATRGYVCMMMQDPSVTDHQPRPMCDVPYESYLSYNGACYKPHNVAKSWQDAETTCIAEGAHLASIQDLTENAFTWVLTKTDDVNSPWIGLNNLNDTTSEQFGWSDGWPTLFTSWGNDQPNTTLTDHKCVRISSDDGLWFNEACDELRPFICKHKDGNVPTPDPPATGTCPDNRWFDLGGGYCYLVVEEEKPWQEANLNCLKEGSNLVSIHSQQEMDLLTIKVHNMRNPLWIGLVQTREGYGWSDGTGFNFVNWELHEPNSDSEQCVEFYTGAGTWNDADCSVVRSSICKTLKKQHVEPTNPPPPEYTTPHQGGLTGHPLSPGGIVGIVIAVLFVVAAVGFVGISFINKKPKPVSQNGAHGFDNALYSGHTDGGKVAMDVADGGSEA